MPGTNAAFKSEAHGWAEDEVPALRSKLDKNAGSPVKNKEKTSGYLKAVPDAEIGGVAEEGLHQMKDEITEQGGQRGKRTARGTTTVPKQFRLIPDVAAALERAAAGEGVSTSRYLNKLLQDNPDIAVHLDIDS